MTFSSFIFLIALISVLISSSSFHIGDSHISPHRTYDEERLSYLRGEVKKVFYEAYDAYIAHAYPFDELRPLSCDGVDTWGSYSLTLIDTLDTLVILGNYSEFRRVATLIVDNSKFDLNINVSVFETNIRIIGGLLSAHLLSYRAGFRVEEGWPCHGPLLSLAEKVARKLLPAFDTNTGMPFGTVNLRYGVPHKETPITCTAGVGTFILEFGTLSRLTGNPLYEKVALRALHSLYSRRSSIDLFGNHIDTESGKWTGVESGIGAGVDSFFEYLVKGGMLFQMPELLQMFRTSFNAIEKHLGKNGWYIWATMAHAHVSTTTFQSLEAYWPGLLSLIGEFPAGLKSITNYHRIWKQYGALPELYNILQGKATHSREGYPLRPELAESAMYLYRGTSDPFMLQIGEDMLVSIDKNMRGKCGFATVRDVTTLTLEDRMESFFLAETLKYLYLLFDPTNFIHSSNYTLIPSPKIRGGGGGGGVCVIGSGGWIFNTEAHPIDPGALQCCSNVGSERSEEEEMEEELNYIGGGGVRSGEEFIGKKQSGKRRRDEEEETNNRRREGGTHGNKEKSSPSLPSLPPQLLKSPPNFLNSSSSPPHFQEDSHSDIQILQPKNLKIPPPPPPSSPRPHFSNLFLPPPPPPQSTCVKIKENSLGLLEEFFSKILEEHKDSGIDLSDISLIRNAIQEPGLSQILLKNEIFGTQVQKIVEKYNLVESSPPNSLQPNRIEKSDKKESELDLIFSPHNSHSLSFYFSLKWIREFPQLISQLIPPPPFDIINFTLKLQQNYEFSNNETDGDRKRTNYGALGCKTLDIGDRFIFHRGTVES